MQKHIIKLLLVFIVVSSQAQVQVKVKWEQSKGDIPTNLFCLNVWDGLRPSTLNDADYQANISDLNLPMVRYHAAEMYKENHEKCWVDYKNQEWDSAIIESSLDALEGLVQNRMITIYNWPNWMKAAGSNKLDTNQIDDFAEWCAALVQIVNVEQNRNVKYWEVFNEVQDNYNGSIAEMADIFNRCAAKMHEVDPTILIGGLAMNHPWWDGTGGELTNFFRLAKDNLGFVSYHHYAGGDNSKSNSELYDSAYNFLSAASGIRGKMTSVGIDKEVPLFLDEFNIFWSWDIDKQRRMASKTGAIFDALVYRSAITAKTVQGVFGWNDRDGVYGKTDSQNNRRPAYYVLKLANELLTGERVYELSSKTSTITALATKMDNSKVIMLINRSDEDQEITFDFADFGQESVTTDIHRISDIYEQETQTINYQESFLIEGESVVFLKIDTENTSVNDFEQHPHSTELLEIYPNPFNPQTTISYQLAQTSLVNINVYNSLGQKVATLIDGKRHSGSHHITWDATKQPSGIYFVSLQTDSKHSTKKVMLIK